MSGAGALRLERLLAKLDLRALGGDRFVSEPGAGRGRLFGGLVAAQSLVAAARSVDAAAPHSLHAYFLRAGLSNAPISFLVERTRDGRRFATRRVVALQDERAIFTVTASFTRVTDGVAHEDPAPAAPPPDGLADWEDVRAQLAGHTRPRREFEAFDVRVLEPERDAPGARSAPARAAWLRLRGAAPADPLLRAALLVYASDRTLLRAAARPHGLAWDAHPPASLDHALWLHRMPALSDWILYDCRSPAASAGRGLVFGALYEAGRRVATVAQEALLAG